MKKLTLNTENCLGCGACVGIDPEHFDFNENYMSYVISEENLDSESLKDAIASCPVQIISLQEDAEEDSCPNCHNQECKCSECDCENEGCQEHNHCH